MRKDTKSRVILMAVKRTVAERDSIDGYPCCINCGKPAPLEAPTAFSCAHFISRAQGGLGIEENIVTLCTECHRRYDQTTDRPILREYIREYLQSKYEGWDEQKLYYRKDCTNA